MINRILFYPSHLIEINSFFALFSVSMCLITFCLFVVAIFSHIQRNKQSRILTIVSIIFVFIPLSPRYFFKFEDPENTVVHGVIIGLTLLAIIQIIVFWRNDQIAKSLTFIPLTLALTYWSFAIFVAKAIAA